jgi:D-3-phosphoglycerate dehydrogenase
MKIVRTDRELVLPRVDETLRNTGAELILLPESIREDALIAATRDADLLLMCYTRITANVIEAATRLKGIVKYGVGIDAIDIEAAQRRGVPVVNVPEYAEETVAEGAFALMLALARRLKPLQRTLERDGWAWPQPEWLAHDLAGKTVGLVGVGRIGRNFARMANGFRMNVLGFDPYVSSDAMRAAGVARRDDLKAMLAECDFVSIHCVLNDETRDLLGAPELAAMKSSAFLINVSRGTIVNEDALLTALATGKIAGAALDVYGEEPVAKTGHRLSALYEMDNVLLWPHLTFYTHEAMQRLEEDTLARCLEILEGRPVLVKSHDPRLRSQARGVRFPD